MGSARGRSSSDCSRTLAPVFAVLVLIAGASTAAADDARAALDALVAEQRPAGGWAFASPPGTRPEPFTLVVKSAERLLAPLGLATWDLVVVRSPGTPAAGLVLIEAWRRTGRDDYLAAARRAGDLLVATQLSSGGWFSELPVDGTATPWWFRWVAATRPNLDDDVTPGAIRLLLGLWSVTGDARYRGAAERAIDLLAGAQMPSGAWPLDARPAWLRRWRPHFEDQPALNDGATPFAITTLLAAASLLGRDDLRERGRRAGEWLVSVQNPPPRAGWAQQYTPTGTPAPARVFEQPALATWETRHAIEALLALGEATGESRYCASAIAAARWLDAVRIGPACWARFHDLETGRPIYRDASGRAVASTTEARPGYSWMGEFGIGWVLVRAGLGTAPARYRLPGDQGRCPEDPAPPRPLTGPRALTADAGALLAGAADVAACAR